MRNHLDATVAGKIVCTIFTVNSSQQKSFAQNFQKKLSKNFEIDSLFWSKVSWNFPFEIFKYCDESLQTLNRIAY